MTEGYSEEGVATIVLPERIDSATSASLEKTILEALRPGARLIIDAHVVSYMSAAGVRTLATVLHHAEVLNADVVFCRFTGAAADCLLVSGFSELFKIAESLEEARRRLDLGESGPALERLHPRQTTG